MKYTFTVPGNPVGYYAVGKRPNWKRMKAYHDYCERVRLYAKAAGIPLPMKASKNEPVMIATLAYFANGIHPDPENVRKGIADSLFYAGKRGNKGSGDKYCAGKFLYPLYDAANPRVEIEIYCGAACRTQMAV